MRRGRPYPIVAPPPRRQLAFGTAAALALPEDIRAAALVAPAVRAHEAVRPAQPEQLLEALVLFTVFVHESVRAETFLEPDRISFHG